MSLIYVSKEFSAMTVKTTIKSRLYYRERGKHVMGPLPLSTLQVAMQSGSLSQSAEVSCDGKEPWVSLSDVLENRHNAFVEHANAGRGDVFVTSANASKGISPMIVTGMVVGTLGIGAFAMNHFVQSGQLNVSDSASSGPKDSKVTQEQVEAAAISCLFWAQSVVSSKQEVEAAEVELSKQRSAGESQLKAIKLQEEKTEREKDVKDFEKKLNELASLEDKAGISGQYSVALRDFVSYGERLATRAELTKKYKSILDPDYKEQYDELSHLRWKIELEEVLDGSYKNGLGAINR